MCAVLTTRIWIGQRKCYRLDEGFVLQITEMSLVINLVHK
jgi:hypothetical protein